MALAVLLAACGATPEPTESPPTQTPWIIVVTSTAASEGEGELESNATPESAPPTQAATPASRPETSSPEPTQPGEIHAKYPPPALQEPPGEQAVPWNSTILLKWSSVGKLAENEYYHIHLERRPKTAGEEWYGDYVFTKETEYRAQGPFIAPFHPAAAGGTGVVYWWVRVVEKIGEDENGKPLGVDISPSSEERTLLLDPKPDDS
ncbi:MAG: hypothetical protein PVF47_11465 [Anaerolineae bacterium]